MARFVSHSQRKWIFPLVGIAFLCRLIAAIPASAQISPGALARAHQALNGPANCTQCHSVSTRSATFRCLECHAEIATELRTQHGLHATFPQTGPSGSACVKCHSDHNGENFNMVHWDQGATGFEHRKTGFLLDGKHATTACRSCHTAQNISSQVRQLLKAKDLAKTFLGLNSSCLSCHEDKHQGRFGSTCTQCHTTSSWKGASIDQHTFDHSVTRFKLVGQHISVPCQKCHTPDTEGRPRYTGLQFQPCAACHTDPHKGEFKQDCSSCHNPNTWERSTFVATFDHSKTKFPLLGKHLNVACDSRHKGGDFKSPIANTPDCDGINNPSAALH